MPEDAELGRKMELYALRQMLEGKKSDPKMSESAYKEAVAKKGLQQLIQKQVENKSGPDDTVTKKD